MRVGQSRKRDDNEAEIVAALRKLGVTVHRISGEGVPDLLCFHPRVGWQPLEVKASKGTLTRAQKIAFLGAPYGIVRNVDEALKFFGFFGIRK